MQWNNWIFPVLFSSLAESAGHDSQPCIGGWFPMASISPSPRHSLAKFGCFFARVVGCNRSSLCSLAASTHCCAVVPCCVRSSCYFFRVLRRRSPHSAGCLAVWLWHTGRCIFDLPLFINSGWTSWAAVMPVPIWWVRWLSLAPSSVPACISWKNNTTITKSALRFGMYGDVPYIQILDPSTLLKHLGMDQYLLIPFLGGWTSIYQLFWCSPGVQGFDTLPSEEIHQLSVHRGFCWWPGVCGLNCHSLTWRKFGGNWSKPFQRSWRSTWPMACSRGTAPCI